MPDFVIRTSNLCLQFERKHVLSMLTLNITSGGVHAIVGARGAGMSALCRVLLGFAAPTSGSARVLGCDSTRLTPDVRGRIGFIDNAHALPVWMRVDQLLAMQRSQYERWDQQRFDSVARQFNVRPEHTIGRMELADRAGLNLALALAQGPELLILDAPTSSLPPTAASAFLEALTYANHEAHTTIVYCSHMMDQIERVADNLVILERGRVRHMSAPATFCRLVQLWVADFPQREPDLSVLPGVLEIHHVDGFVHLLVYNQNKDFGTRLRLLGASSVHAMQVSLDRAVNGFLSGAPSVHPPAHAGVAAAS
ncbi:MAG: ATP-binding cassette domain-containing protein [Pseudomonadota bacterium]